MQATDSSPQLAPPDPAVPATSRAARRLPVLGGSALAFGLAGLGEFLLFGRHIIGASVLLVAMAVGAWAWKGLAPAPSLVPRPAGGATAGAGRRLVGWRLAGIAGALLLLGGSLLAWFADPAAIFGLQGWLWLASIALLLLVCARWYPPANRETDLGPAWTRAETALFLGLIALALLTYTADLHDIPWTYHADEVNGYHEVLRFAAGPMIPLFTTTWMDTTMPSLFFSFAGGLMRLAGDGLAGARLGVALISALTVIPLYGLVRLAWGRAAAAIAGFAWATTAVAVHYSRTTEINMTTPFAWTICFYFLLRGLRSRRPGDFVWAGLAAGLSQYTYYATRLLPYLLLIYIAYLAVVHFRAWREQIGLLALMGAGFLVGFGPQLAYFLRYPGDWVGRGLQQLNVPAAIPATWAEGIADIRVLGLYGWLNFLSLSVEPGRDGYYALPFLLPAQAALVLLGAGVLIWRWRCPAAFLLLLWGGGILFVGGTLIGSTHIPAFIHWTPAFPVFFVALALPPALGLRALRAAGARTWHAGLAVVAVGLLGLAGANAYTYLVTYPAQVRPGAEVAQARFLSTLEPGTQVYFVGNGEHPYDRGQAAMLAPDIPARDLVNPSRELPLADDAGHALVFVFYPEQHPYLPVVQSYYPGGHVYPVIAPNGTHLADTYQVPASQARNPTAPAPGPIAPGAGLAATLAEATIVHRIDPFVGAGALDGPAHNPRNAYLAPWDPELVPLAVPRGAAPPRIRWAGEVYADQGDYALELRTDARARLWIDGALVLDLCANHPLAGTYTGGAALVTLTPAWHAVQLDYVATGTANGIEWLWTQPGGTREIVPPARLRHAAGAWPASPPPITCARR